MWVPSSVIGTELSIYISIIISFLLLAWYSWERASMSETWWRCKKKWVYSPEKGGRFTLEREAGEQAAWDSIASWPRKYLALDETCVSLSMVELNESAWI